MSEENDLAVSLNEVVVSTRVSTQRYGTTRARYYRIASSAQNIGQYGRTIKAYILAGMPLNDIANTGDFIGDLVERGEIDAPILESSTKANRVSDVVESKGRIFAWQDRGGSVSSTGQSLEVVGKGLEEIEVVEGIEVKSHQVEAVNESVPSNVSQLDPSHNPYLSAPADLKKAV